MIKRLVLILIIFILVSNLSACDRGVKDEKFSVAVSIVPQATFVKAVGGELIDVVTMIPPGNSPGNYAPSPGELMKFSDASIYFSMGVPADLANILPEARDFNSRIKIVKLFEEVGQYYIDREFAPGNRDPHIWLSPRRVKVMIDVIARELAAADVENKDTYIKNAEEYKLKLDQLDQEIRDSLEGIENITFIAYHPSFGYFADDYGLEMISIEEEGKEATPRRLQEIIDRAREDNIKAIFYQEEIDSRQADVIAEEIGGRTEQISPLAADYITNLLKTAELFREVLK